MLRVTDQIVNPRQALLPEAEGQSFTHLVYLCILGPFKIQGLDRKVEAFAVIP